MEDTCSRREALRYLGDLADISDFQDLGEIKNRVTIEGADQAIFQTTDKVSTSKLTGEASDATSIAAYLEKTCAITNQLFEDQGSLTDMCATLLAEFKDPKLYAEIKTFANVVPLEVGETVRWRIELGALAVDMVGIIRSISISGSSISYKCEVTAAAEGLATGILVVQNAVIGMSSSGTSLVPQAGVATRLAPANAAIALTATSPTVAAGLATNYYMELDAFQGTGEVDTINAHWTTNNVTITSAADAGGGSTYVGLIVRGAATGSAYTHSVHIADVVAGLNYTLDLKYSYSIGTRFINLRIYQTVGGVLQQIGTTKVLSQASWTDLPQVAFTALATAPLQLRIEFASGSAEGDEIRVDQIKVYKTA